MPDLTEMAKELKSRICECEQCVDSLNNLAKYVQKMILEARIEELNHYKIYRDDDGEIAEERIAELKEQLKALDGEERKG